MKVRSVWGTAVIPHSRTEKRKGRCPPACANEPKPGDKGKDCIREQRRLPNRRLRRRYHCSRERRACRQTIQEQPSLKFTAETLTSTRSQVPWYQLALKDGGPSERFEGRLPWRTVVK